MKKILALATLAVVLGAGTASAQYAPYVTNGKGQSSGGYQGELGRRLGVDPIGANMDSGQARRPDPRLASGKGQSAGGYRGYVDRQVGTDRTGTTVNPGRRLRTDPRLVSGKGQSAGGYRGEYGRRIGVDAQNTGSVGYGRRNGY